MSFTTPLVSLAPMAGVTDIPFRRQVKAFGGRYCVSEMVASEQLARERIDMVRRAAGAGVILPLVVQLAGREARWMADGARLAADAGANVIDINMGCPSKSVTSGLCGSALMREPDRALALIEVVTSQLDTLPSLFAQIADLPRAFLLFLDDLGFDAAADGRALRSMLDGGAEARPANARLVVTSNRRHLVPREMIDQPTAVNPRDAADDALGLVLRYAGFFQNLQSGRHVTLGCRQAAGSDVPSLAGPEGDEDV
jgi:hypothetical protein